MSVNNVIARAKRIIIVHVVHSLEIAYHGMTPSHPKYL
jgi:hypothetical protein